MTLRVVRARTAEQFAAIAKLQKQVLPFDQPHETDAGAWWVVYDEETPAAFGGVIPSSQWGDAVYLCRAGVAVQYRGKGLQKRLITARERYARAAGMKWAVTDTTNNPASANSLISRGFKLFDPSRPWGPKGALYWKKRLAR